MAFDEVLVEADGAGEAVVFDVLVGGMHAGHLLWAVDHGSEADAVLEVPLIIAGVEAYVKALAPLLPRDLIDQLAYRLNVPVPQPAPCPPPPPPPPKQQPDMEKLFQMMRLMEQFRPKPPCGQ